MKFIDIKTLKDAFKRERKCLNKEEYEYRNMLTVAELITDAALKRKESIGAHCRKDSIKKEIVNVK
jgi:aspartate oxidase